MLKKGAVNFEFYGDLNDLMCVNASSTRHRIAIQRDESSLRSHIDGNDYKLARLIKIFMIRFYDRQQLGKQIN